MLGDININLEPYEYKLFLCKPDRTTLGELTEAYSKKLTFNYGGINELTFSLPYIVEKNKEFIRNKHVDMLRGHYLIRLERKDENDLWITKEYFIITKPKDNSDNGVNIKEVQCYSLPYQFRNKTIRAYEGTKSLSEVILETIGTKTDWSIGYISDSLNYSDEAKTIFKRRTFDEAQTNLLDFHNQINESFDAIPIYDTLNKQISFYKDSELGEDKGLLIEYGKYLKTINQEPDFDNVVTRLYCYGKDDLNFRQLSPTGVDYVEDLSYYLYPFTRDGERNVLTHSYYMSDALCHAILDYDILLETKTDEFNAFILTKEGYQTTLTAKNNEMTILTDAMAVIDDNIDIAKANGDSIVTLLAQKTAKQAEIDAKQVEIDGVQGQIDTVDVSIVALQTEIAIENNFTAEQIIERDSFIVESTWSDTNYTDVNDLYIEGLIQLNKLHQPLIAYTIDVVDFLKVVQCQRDWKKLNIGDIMTIRFSEFNIDIKAKIITIVHDIDDNSINLTIANSKDIKSGFVSYKDLVKQSNSTSSQVSMSSYKWDKSEVNETQISNIINNAWDATKQAIIGGENESVQISRRGLKIINPLEPLKYIVCQHGILGFTVDGGETWKTAISPDMGVVAEAVRGVLGEFCTLRADQIVVGDSGEQISDDLIASASVWNSLQSQIDGQITTWFYGYEPTLLNVPASDWTTDILKNNHLGDLFYNTATGYGYRFALVSTVYQWIRITDVDVVTALANAQLALDTADGKRRVFSNIPTVPYDVGDLWSGGNTGDLKRCKTAKTITDTYSINDWELATKYTDDTVANNKNSTFGGCPTDGVYKQDDIMIPAVDFINGATTFYAGELYQALIDGDGASFNSAHWTSATLLSDWKATGKTTIDGGKIEADTVTANALIGDTAMINFINALSIVAGSVSATNVTAGTLNADNIRLKTTDGSLDINGNTATFVHTNGTSSVLGPSGLVLYEGTTALPYVSTVLTGMIDADTDSGWSDSDGWKTGNSPIYYTFTYTGARWAGKAANVQVMVSPRGHVYAPYSTNNTSHYLFNTYCELYSVTDITNGVQVKIMSYDTVYESGILKSCWLAFNYMIVLN